MVRTATARETKTTPPRPYLALELFDGTDVIHGNYWTWAGKAIPEKNTVLDVEGQVTEWQGKKQLNIKSISTCLDHELAEFMPSSGHDASDIYKQAYSLAAGIEDGFLSGLCVGLLEDLYSLWLTAPGARTVHHAYTAGTLIHSLSVATLAKALAEKVEGANVSMATAGGLLHDLGKLYAYTINGVSCDMTDEGLLYDHLFIGAEFVGNYVENHALVSTVSDELKLEMLRHIILSHHGTREQGAVVLPASIEALIVHHADAVDAAAEQIREASRKTTAAKFTERVWGLGNVSALSTGYVGSVMGSASESEEA